MSRPPRPPSEPFLAGWTAPLLVVPALLLSLVTLIAFVVALGRSTSEAGPVLAEAQSAAFATLLLAHLGIGWAQRSSHESSFGLAVGNNPVLLVALVGGAALLLPLLYTDFGQEFFHTRPLDPAAWAVTLALAPLPLLGSELVKWLARRKAG